MFDVLYDLQKWKPECLKDFPLLKGFYDRIGSRSKIVDFLNRDDIKDMPITGGGKL